MSRRFSSARPPLGNALRLQFSSSPLIFVASARAFRYAIALFKDFQHAAGRRERGIDARSFIDKNVSRASSQSARNRLAFHIARPRRTRAESLLRKCARSALARGSSRRSFSSRASSRRFSRTRFFPRLVSSVQNRIKKNDVLHILRSTCSFSLFFSFRYCYYFLITLFFLFFRSFYRIYCSFSYITALYNVYFSISL